MTTCVVSRLGEDFGYGCRLFSKHGAQTRTSTERAWDEPLQAKRLESEPKRRFSQILAFSQKTKH